MCTLDHVIGSPRAHVSMSDTLASCMAAHCHCLTQSMQCSVVMCLQLANTLSVGACSCVPSSEMYMRMHANPLWSCTTIWRQYCNPSSQRPTLVLHLKLYLWLVDNMTNQTNQQCQSQNTWASKLMQGMSTVCGPVVISLWVGLLYNIHAAIEVHT